MFIIKNFSDIANRTVILESLISRGRSQDGDVYPVDEKKLQKGRGRRAYTSDDDYIFDLPETDMIKNPKYHDQLNQVTDVSELKYIKAQSVLFNLGLIDKIHPGHTVYLNGRNQTRATENLNRINHFFKRNESMLPENAPIENLNTLLRFPKVLIDNIVGFNIFYLLHNKKSWDDVFGKDGTNNKKLKNAIGGAIMGMGSRARDTHELFINILSKYANLIDEKDSKPNEDGYDVDDYDIDEDEETLDPFANFELGAASTNSKKDKNKNSDSNNNPYADFNLGVAAPKPEKPSKKGSAKSDNKETKVSGRKQYFNVSSQRAGVNSFSKSMPDRSLSITDPEIAEYKKQLATDRHGKNIVLADLPFQEQEELIKKFKYDYAILVTLFKAAENANMSPSKYLEFLNSLDYIAGLLTIPQIQRDISNLEAENGEPKTIGDFKKNLVTAVSNMFREKADTEHITTSITRNAVKRLKYLAKDLSKKGYKGGLTPENIFDFIKNDDSKAANYARESLISKYNINPETDLTTEKYPNFKTFVDDLYNRDSYVSEFLATRGNRDMTTISSKNFIDRLGGANIPEETMKSLIDNGVIYQKLRADKNSSAYDNLDKTRLIKVPKTNALERSKKDIKASLSKAIKALEEFEKNREEAKELINSDITKEWNSNKLTHQSQATGRAINSILKAKSPIFPSNDIVLNFGELTHDEVKRLRQTCQEDAGLKYVVPEYRAKYQELISNPDIFDQIVEGLCGQKKYIHQQLLHWPAREKAKKTFATGLKFDKDSEEYKAFVKDYTDKIKKYKDQLAAIEVLEDINDENKELEDVIDEEDTQNSGPALTYICNIRDEAKVKNIVNSYNKNPQKGTKLEYDILKENKNYIVLDFIVNYDSDIYKSKKPRKILNSITDFLLQRIPNITLIEVDFDRLTSTFFNETLSLVDREPIKDDFFDKMSNNQDFLASYTREFTNKRDDLKNSFSYETLLSTYEECKRTGFLVPMFRLYMLANENPNSKKAELFNKFETDIDDPEFFDRVKESNPDYEDIYRAFKNVLDFKDYLELDNPRDIINNLFIKLVADSVNTNRATIAVKLLRSKYENKYPEIFEWLDNGLKLYKDLHVNDTTKHHKNYYKPIAQEKDTDNYSADENYLKILKYISYDQSIKDKFIKSIKSDNYTLAKKILASDNKFLRLVKDSNQDYIDLNKTFKSLMKNDIETFNLKKPDPDNYFVYQLSKLINTFSGYVAIILLQLEYAEEYPEFFQWLDKSLKLYIEKRTSDIPMATRLNNEIEYLKMLKGDPYNQYLRKNFIKKLKNGDFNYSKKTLDDNDSNNVQQDSDGHYYIVNPKNGKKVYTNKNGDDVRYDPDDHSYYVISTGGSIIKTDRYGNPSSKMLNDFDDDEDEEICVAKDTVTFIPNSKKYPRAYLQDRWREQYMNNY